MGDSEMHALVRGQLLEALADVQQHSCREVPPMTGDTVPLSDLPGFDSLCGVEAMVILEERLGFELKDVPFTVPGGFRELKVNEIVDAIVHLHRSFLARGPEAVGAPGVKRGGAR